MGRMYIEGFKDQGIGLDQLLKIHLTGNHYPPVSLDFIPACKEAIEYCNAEESTSDVMLPNGIKKEAWQVVEGLHLDSFLDLAEVDYPAEDY